MSILFTISILVNLLTLGFVGHWIILIYAPDPIVIKTECPIVTQMACPVKEKCEVCEVCSVIDPDAAGFDPDFCEPVFVEYENTEKIDACEGSLATCLDQKAITDESLAECEFKLNFSCVEDEKGIE